MLLLLACKVLPIPLSPGIQLNICSSWFGPSLSYFGTYRTTHLLWAWHGLQYEGRQSPSFTSVAGHQARKMCSEVGIACGKGSSHLLGEMRSFSRNTQGLLRRGQGSIYADPLIKDQQLSPTSPDHGCWVLGAGQVQA